MKKRIIVTLLVLACLIGLMCLTSCYEGSELMY